MKKIISVFTVLLLVVATAFKSHAQVSVGVSINIAPPVLPTYSQPPCPVDGYLWTPGYWAYDADNGYYWVPGVWVHPPRIGYLWTPGYWGYDGAIYVFHEGYWGRHIGFYGGVNYGYGYGGSGYVGGRWAGNSFQYNTAVVNVNTTVVHNTYINRTVINNNETVNNNSFNGPGGVATKPNTRELSAAKEDHVQPTTEQVNHRQVAGKDKSQFANNNNGRPSTTAMNKVGGNRFASDGNQRQRPVKTNDNASAQSKPDNNKPTPSSDNQRDQQTPDRNNSTEPKPSNRNNSAEPKAPKQQRPHAIPQHRSAVAPHHEGGHRGRR
ncbi:hypothetical protein AAFN85_18235 [Mucilaginibacter sp. CAU 1740]|uniref:YXWGXW repeat-containing protein n=1 Tax=Mucilaginibacter sp. CAU 1740 TaxID=3140365 RepID=UPI00325BCC4A